MQTIDQIPEGDRDRYSSIFVRGMRQAILPAQDAVGAGGITLENLSVLVKSNFTQMKAEARDVEHLQQLYGTLKLVLKPTLGVS